MTALRRLSLRVRLVLACTAVAAVVGAAGLTLFNASLHRGVAASMDTVLAARSARAVQLFEAAGPPRSATGPAADPAGSGTTGEEGAVGRDEPDSMTVIYRPSGVVASSSPTGLGAGLLGREQAADARLRVLHLTVNSDGQEPLRVMSAPVTRPDGTWVVVVATSLVPATAAADRAVHDLDIGALVLLVLVAVGAWALAGAALRPVERMRADAEKLIETGSSSAVLTVPATSDELARLGRTFNHLLQRVQRSLARQRDLVADTGHELRTPLTVLRTELELADSPERSREELADSVHHARREVERLSKLAEDMLFLARADSEVPLVHVEPVDLAAVVGESERAQRARAESLGVTLESEVHAPLVVPGDHQALRRALDNLVANSLAAVGPGGRVKVVAEARGDRAVMEVSDDGPGFPPGFVGRAFDRFSRPDTARPSGQGGAGLGLAIVSEIARALDGSVTAGDGEDGGARVTLELPFPGPGTAAPVPGSRQAPAPGVRGGAGTG